MTKNNDKTIPVDSHRHKDAGSEGPLLRRFQCGLAAGGCCGLHLV